MPAPKTGAGLDGSIALIVLFRMEFLFRSYEDDWSFRSVTAGSGLTYADMVILYAL